ncbi:MAG: hypothetical protein JXA54_11065 [Candidatus Heimdallarchaeota archaeon]|nr:hypothetical protein [Candidatus Heimdallarchaeota archaeon]
MEVQDYISYKQEIVKNLTSEQVEQAYKDENLLRIIKYLRKGPKTVKELVQDFNQEGINKSDKSIYRYLKDLIEIKLIARAGKRITSKNESELQTETIYIRTAKIFLTGAYTDKSKKLKGKQTQIFNELVKELLSVKFRDTVTSTTAIGELISKLDKEKHQLIVELFENASHDTLEKVSILEWDLIEHLVEYIGWLALSLNLNILDEIKKCCEKQ